MNGIKKTLSASRPFLWVNTAFPFAFGWMVVTQETNWLFFVGFIFFLFPYNLAMYGINDIFDFESDQKNPRKASLEGAQLAKAELLKLWKYIIVFALPFIVVLAYFGTATSNILFLFSLFMVVAYSAIPFRFKELPFLDSFTSSCHFVTPFLFGVLLVGGSLSHYIPAIIAFFLWGIASHAFGAIQDIVFDREAHIASVATVFGARATLYFSAIAYMFSAGIVFLSYQSTSGWIASVALSLFAVNTLRFYSVTDTTAAKTNSGWHVFMALSLGTGALFTTGFLYLYRPYGITQLAWYMPLIISTITFLFFIVLLRKK